jgi:hypothetical protein
MGSISWAELYFRSLKRIKVLSLLTKYLLQYRRLSIPHVGTFELLQQSPEFNVVDKMILPPSFRLNWNNSDALPEHQISYIAATINADKESIKQDLDLFGKKFKSQVQKQPFNWNGIGTIKADNGTIDIDNEIKVDGLESVAAHKLLRENAQHQVLVGDQEMTSQQVAHSLSQTGKKKAYVVWIGWILFILTLLAIAFILYKNGFNPLSSGLKTKASGNSIY